MFQISKLGLTASCALRTVIKGPRGNVSTDFHSFCRILRRCLSSHVVSTKESVAFRIDSPEFYAIFTPELKKLDSIFRQYGHELRIVGGAVRDLLSGKKPIDVDFATTATPQQMKEMFEIENIRILHKKGEKHGTIATRVNDRENFEITTLRIDVSTDGRHAEVEFTTDWKKDAARRDLTINSMFLDMEGNLYDFFNGYEDLKNKRVVFVGDAKMRIEEDYLRILRYFRFFGRIVEDPNSHDKCTLDAIRLTASGLQKISGERIWSEFSRILSGNFVLEIVQKMLDLGLGPYIGLAEVNELDMPCFIRVCHLNKKYSFKPISYVAALLKNEDQVLHFHARVKLSSYERNLALFLINYKSEDVSIESPTRLRQFQRIVALTNIGKEQMREYVIEVFKFRNESELLAQFEAWHLPPFPITIKMLKNRGVKNFNEANEVLSKMKMLWVDSDFQLTQENILDQLPSILRGIQDNKQ